MKYTCFCFSLSVALAAGCFFVGGALHAQSYQIGRSDYGYDYDPYYELFDYGVLEYGLHQDYDAGLYDHGLNDDYDFGFYDDHLYGYDYDYDHAFDYNDDDLYGYNYDDLYDYGSDLSEGYLDLGYPPLSRADSLAEEGAYGYGCYGYEYPGYRVGRSSDIGGYYDNGVFGDDRNYDYYPDRF